MSHSLRSGRIALVFAISVLGSMAAAQPASAFRDLDCADFSTQAKAQRFFEKHHPRRDPHRLDGDNDGLACKILP